MSIASGATGPQGPIDVTDPGVGQPLGPQGVLVYDDFLKVDMRVGSIVSAERVPKSDKLLKLQINFGEVGIRQIVAGIGKSFEPEQLVGTKICAVLNLAPRKLMGVESHGMILAAHSGEELFLVNCGAAPGSQLG